MLKRVALIYLLLFETNNFFSYQYLISITIFNTLTILANTIALFRIKFLFLDFQKLITRSVSKTFIIDFENNQKVYFTFFFIEFCEIKFCILKMKHLS